MTSSVRAFLSLLDLEEIRPGAYLGGSPATSTQRLFGGQVAAQSVRAAALTVPPDRSIHSLHAYFLRAGDPREPIRYEVERVRDGRKFSARRVVALQGGRTIFSLAASFQIAREGLTHQDAPPAAADPETLPTLRDRVAGEPSAWSPIYRECGSFDVRYATDPSTGGIPSGGRAAHAQVWLRSMELLPDDPVVHACALTYASDLTLLSASLLPHGLTPVDEGLMMASLDHAIWIHRPFRADNWLLYDQHSPSASNELALVSGRIFDQEGHLVATVMQEGLIRPPR